MDFPLDSTKDSNFVDHKLIKHNLEYRKPRYTYIDNESVRNDSKNDEIHFT